MADSGLPTHLRLTLRSCTVYYFQHRALASPEPHFFAVINSDPVNDSVLILAVGSSKLDKVRERRDGLPGECLVVVDPADYPEFSKTTVFDCNHVFEIAMAELIQKLQGAEIRHHSDLPSQILEKVWRGVRLSPLVDDQHKKLLPSA